MRGQERLQPLTETKGRTGSNFGKKEKQNKGKKTKRAEILTVTLVSSSPSVVKMEKCVYSLNKLFTLYIFIANIFVCFYQRQWENILVSCSSSPLASQMTLELRWPELQILNKCVNVAWFYIVPNLHLHHVLRDFTCPLPWRGGLYGSTRVCVSSVTMVVVVVQFRPPSRELMADPEKVVRFSLRGGGVFSSVRGGGVGFPGSSFVAGCGVGRSSFCARGTSLVSWGPSWEDLTGVETLKSSITSPFTRTNPSIWAGRKKNK